MHFFERVRALAELMRVANVFTAISNVWMGMIITTGTLPGWAAVGITATSALLYLAGIVLNDAFDHKIDMVERPERPVPSGRISLRVARALGWSLLAAGVVCGWATTLVAPTSAPGWIATILAALVVAYDAELKNTSLGPVAMALCRFTNVLLGFSLGGIGVQEGAIAIDTNLTPAIGIAIYVWSISWFARSEAGESKPALLGFSTLGALLGLLLIVLMPFVDAALNLRISPVGWIVLWIVVAGSIIRRMVVAIWQPTPKYVQRAVGHAIISLIVIDAAICLGFADPFWACSVLMLLAPAMLLSQFIRVT